MAGRAAVHDQHVALAEVGPTAAATCVVLPGRHHEHRLLPLAHRGLERSGMDAAWREPLLGVIEQRCVTARNGAVWQKVATTAAIDQVPGDRHEARGG